MPCSMPLAIPIDDKIKFHRVTGSNSSHRMVPCGQCISCRMAKKKEWALRCMHEQRQHKSSLFLTLTYDEITVPRDGSLNTVDIELFIKRLRRHYDYHYNIKGIKYLQAGEYGRVCKNCGNHIRRCRCGEYLETLGRPHHHMCVFGIDFHDKKLSKLTKNNGHLLYESETLDKLWTKGIAVIGELNEKTAAYTASYITKRIVGEMSENYYEGKLPEYATMSRRPGIGKKFYEKYAEDFKKLDAVVLDKNRKAKIPRYYDKLTKANNEEEFEKIKERRGKKYEIPSSEKIMHIKQKEINVIKKRKLTEGKLK